MSLPRIAVLYGTEASCSAWELVRAADGVYELIFFVEPTASGTALEEVLSRLTSTEVCPREAWPELATRIRPAGAVTFDDGYLEDLDDVLRAANLLGLPGVDAAWDKLVQRRAFNAAGASETSVFPVESLEDLDMARSFVRGPAFLKPRRSSMSRGMVLVDSTTDSADAWRLTAQHRPVLLETVMPATSVGTGLAPFVSVDTASHGSHRHHFGFNDKLGLVRAHLETGVIGPTTLELEVRTTVLKAVEAALASLGIEDRVTHTEVRLTPKGAEVLEVNGRLGGHVTGLARGISAFDACRAALDVSVGNPLAAGAAPVIVGVGQPTAVLMLPLDRADDSTVRRATEALRGLSSVRQVSPSAPQSSSFRTVPAWFSAETRAELLAALRSAVATVSDDPALKGHLDRAWVDDVVQLGA